MALIDKLTGIANAIREKTGSTGSMTLSEMPTAIFNIQSDGNVTIPYIEETYNSDGDLIDAKLHGYTSIRDRLFYYCSNLALTSLPIGITSIGGYAFYHCSNLALTSLPSGITSIGDYAFSGCKNLTTITFKGTPSFISTTAFYNCDNLTTIKVPWSEGEVDGAPWGAPIATITYNYTEE